MRQESVVGGKDQEITLEIPEPEFEGHPLSFWIEELLQADPEVQHRAVEAIHELPGKEWVEKYGTSENIPGLDLNLRRALDSTFSLPGVQTEEILHRLLRLWKNTWYAFRMRSDDPALSIITPEERGLWKINPFSQWGGSLHGAKFFGVFMIINKLVGSVGGAGLGILDELIELLKDEHRDFYWRAAEMIANIGPAAKPAVPALFEVMSRRGVKEWPYKVGKALAAIATVHEDVFQRIAETLEGGDANSKEGAGMALIYMEKAATPALPQLIRVTQKAEEKEPRRCAIAALGKIGRDDDDILEALLHAAKDDAWWVRGTAIRALGEIGKKPECVMPAIIDALDDEGGNPDWTVRECAVEAIGKFGTDAEKAVPNLVKHLVDEYEDIDFGVVQSLRKIGPGAKSAAPMLRRLFETHAEKMDEESREKILNALLAINDSQGNDAGN